MQKHANLVDLVKSFPTNIFLQNLASIQVRTSPVKFAHLAEKSGKGSISNLSTKVDLPRHTSHSLEPTGRPVSETGDWRNDITLRDAATTVAVWTWSRFQGRLQRMRDIYQESLDRGLEAVQEDLRARPHLDPWLELQEDDYEVPKKGLTLS